MEDGDAILATGSGEGFETRRIPSTKISSLDIREPILILPGQLVRILETDLPKAGRKQQLQMARFAREDDIAASADTVHFALSSHQPPKVAVIDKSVMDRLVQTLGGLKPKAAYAEYDLLRGNEAIQILDRAVEPGFAALDIDWKNETLLQPTDRDLAAQFSQGLREGLGINLLQDAYRPQSSVNLPRVPTARFAGLAASALVALFVWHGVKDRAAAAQAKELRAQTAADYLSATGKKATSNPGRLAAQSVRAGPSKSAGFLDLSNVLFSGLESMDDIRVDQLRYNAKDGTLRLRLIYPDLAMLAVFITWFALTRDKGTDGSAELQAAQMDRELWLRAAPRLNSAAVSGSRSDFTRGVLVDAAKKRGVNLSRVQPQPGGGLSIWIDEASTPLLYGLIRDLVSNYSVEVETALITSAANGGVNAQLTLAPL